LTQPQREKDKRAEPWLETVLLNISSAEADTSTISSGPGNELREDEPRRFDGEASARNPRELALAYGVEFVDLAREQVAPEAADAIPLRVLERLRVIPYRLDGDCLKVAVRDPGDVGVVDELKLATQFDIDFAVAAHQDIDRALRRLARGKEFSLRAAAAEDEPIAVKEPRRPEQTTDLEADDGVSDAPPIRLVNSIIVQASEDDASDIHFLPRDDGLSVRVRIDGVVHEVNRIPRRYATGVITRLKVLAKLDITEHRRPQDGRMSLRAKQSGRLLDVRVAVLPTVGGEGVLMRLLDKSKRPPTLTEIGLSNTMQMALEETIHNQTGALLCTGPTGSGKSTTAYAALADIVRPEINVITVEDPVEYRLEDVYQIQVDMKVGLSFATALRAILRSDPDVVMVGEIRDLESAKISVEAALTGHFVLSTMHANDAPSAVTRLTELGVDPHFTGAAVTAVVSQRLVRRLCLNCREPYQPSAEEFSSLRFPLDRAEAATFFRKRGCGACYKGYRGRLGVYQLMPIDHQVRDLIGRAVPRHQLEQGARASGMRSLWEDGLEKLGAGLTTTEELRRTLR
jgi:type IV pilus assembly protein PilB